MKKKLTYKYYLILFFIILFTSTGCGNAAKQTSTLELGTSLPPSPSPDDTIISSEISFDGASPEYFAYNMASNSMTLIERSDNTYTLHRLQSDGTLQHPGIHWKISGDFFLDNFVHGSDGSLYAAKKHYDKKGKTFQSLIKLQNNGMYRNVKLKEINTVPKTKLDSYIQKKGGKADHSITDIRFSGTALAITYSNYAVKFYNIAEGMPLGDANLTGAAGRNAFFDNIFVTTGLTSGHSDTLHSFDIRTGEKINSLSVDGILFLTSYRETLYLLTKNGLYKGKVGAEPNSMSFSPLADFKALHLPAGGRIHKLYAAREDTLYLSYQDSRANMHLYKISCR